MAEFVSFGEIMLRLKAPGHERLMQSPSLEASFGGGEANVAVSLANYGLDAAFVSVLPNNDLAEACLRELRGFGVDCSWVRRAGDRMGIYFLETGAMQRPSKVIYDRAGSSIAQAGPGDIDWEGALGGAKWFHITGITPAISQRAADLSLEAVKKARSMGVTISCDLNYRKNLWQYGKSAQQVMHQLIQHVDVIVANEEDFQQSLGISAGRHDVESGELDTEAYQAIAREAMARYPQLQLVTVTLRQAQSADRNRWQACLYDGKQFLLSRSYDLLDIVDRVGGGDSFAAGLIYGLNRLKGHEEALAFAVAASALKHSIGGDYNRVSVQEVEALMRGAGTGRVQR